MAERERFVERWARLKAEQQERKLDPPAAPDLRQSTEENLPAPPSAAPEEAPGEDERTDAELLAEHGLPDIDSLTEESDFTGFMKEGVPERLRNLALRKLWRSNPVFANLDGLNDYDEDFSQVVDIVGTITNYLPGRGYVDEGPPTEDAAEAEDRATANDVAASGTAAGNEAPATPDTASADASTDEAESAPEGDEEDGKAGS